MDTALISATFVLLNAVIFLCVQASMCFRIKMSPQKYTEESTGVVKIACVLDTLDHCVHKNVIMLELRKAGETPVAFVQQNFGVKYGADYDKKYAAQGVVDNRRNTTFLNVTLTAPDNDDSGRYTCNMHYINEAGVFAEDTDSKNLTVEIFSVHTSLKTVLAAVSQLQHELIIRGNEFEELRGKYHRQFQELEHLKDSHYNQSQEMEDLKQMAKESHQNQSHQITALVHKGNEFEELRGKYHRQFQELEHLKESLYNQSQEMEHLKQMAKESHQNQSHQITALVDKVTYNVAFSASLSAYVTASSGSVVKYNAVLLNEGNCYNTATGEFTAPRKGLYSFHLTSWTQGSGKTAQLHIVANGINVASVHSYDGDNYEQTSISGLAVLEAGAKVKVQSYSTSQLRGDGSGDYQRNNKFSGYLVKLL